MAKAAPRPQDAGALLIQLGDGPTLTSSAKLTDVLPKDACDALPDSLRNARVSPLLTPSEHKRMSVLLARACHCDSHYQPARFDRLALLDVPTGTEPLALAKAVDGTVHRVGYAVAVPPPAAGPSPVAVPAELSWLQATPNGIGAEPVWARPATAHLTGSGATVLVVERGVRTNARGQVDHTDIDGRRAALATSHPRFAKRNDDCTAGEKEHGVRTLGVLMAGIDALPNSGSLSADQLPLGLVPECDGITVYPIGTVAQTQRDDLQHTVDAILAALSDSAPGDIMLVEAQANTRDGLLWVPLEYVGVFHDLFRLGTALGVTVIAPAGNGHHDLDTLPMTPGLRDLRARDSGAVLVGMGAQRGTDWYATGTRGARVDCFGPGRNVVTTAWGPDSAGDRTVPTHAEYSGTSAAAAVIAGTAAFLQGAARSRGMTLGPAQLRSILRNPALCTPTVPDQRIGGLPDLDRMVNTVLALPDLVIRDSLRDDGSPQGAPTARSPDIAVGPADVPLPTEPNKTATVCIDATIDHQVAVWVRNRGSRTATGATVDLYWAHPTCLPTPDAWTHIGTASVPDVPPGFTPVRSEPVRWPASEIPHTGHYCLVAVAQSPADSAPLLPVAERFDWAAWAAFVGRNNNIAWRNLHGVSAAPGATLTLPFDVRGAPDRSLAFELKIETRLPEGSQAHLRHAGRMITKAQFGATTALRRKQWLTIDRKQSLGPSRVTRGARWPMAIVIHLPRGTSVGGEVTVRQCRGGREFGRITWTLLDEH